MRIAVASQNFRTVTAHAGKTRRFLVFETAPEGTVAEVDRLDLPREMSLHDFHGDGDHPLYAMDAIIAGSAGPGFVRRLESRGVRVAATLEQDPLTAVRGFIAGTLPPAPPHDHGADPHHHHRHHSEGAA